MLACTSCALPFFSSNNKSNAVRCSASRQAVQNHSIHVSRCPTYVSQHEHGPASDTSFGKPSRISLVTWPSAMLAGGVQCSNNDSTKCCRCRMTVCVPLVLAPVSAMWRRQHGRTSVCTGTKTLPSREDTAYATRGGQACRLCAAAAASSKQSRNPIFYLQMVWQILTSAASATTEHLISSSTKLCTVSCISPGSQTVMLAIMHCRWR